MKYLILIFFFFIGTLNGQIEKKEKIRKAEIYGGISAGIQENYLYEYTASTRDINILDGPHWLLCYQFGINYKFINYKNLALISGLLFHEKGASHYFGDAFNNKEIVRKELVANYLLFTLQVEYNIKNKIEPFIGFTYGRHLFEFIDVNEWEYAVVSGFKIHLYKNLKCGLMFNQGLNLQNKDFMPRYYTNCDFNIIFSF